MHSPISLLALLAASAVSAAAAAAGPAPIPATITAAPAADPAVTNHHLPAREQQQQSQSQPSPTTPTPQPACESSLTALLSALPSPTPTALLSWASSSAPILLILRAIQSNYAFPSLLLPGTSPTTTTPSTNTITDINALCTAAAALVTAPTDLATAYSVYLDAVQMWRFDVEGDAYRLAERCGGEVGLGLELLMATEAAMCTSGIWESVRPWKTGGGMGDGFDGNRNGVGNGARAGFGRGVVVVVIGVAVVVGGVVGL